MVSFLWSRVDCGVEWGLLVVRQMVAGLKVTNDWALEEEFIWALSFTIGMHGGVQGSGKDACL